MIPGDDIYPERKPLPHRPPPWVRASAIFFITINCRVRGENQLCHDATASILWETVTFRQQRDDWFVHLWLLMPDHLHALVSFSRETEFTKTIAKWKEITAKRAGISWQRDFFDHRLRSHESLQQKAAYIRNNPVRKGLVSDAANWKFAREPTAGPAVPPYLQPDPW